jgi:hypothetical protein
VRTDIFDLSDPGTSAWPYRWANALHVLTRENFIRSLLLVREGDPLDPETMIGAHDEPDQVGNDNADEADGAAK